MAYLILYVCTLICLCTMSRLILADAACDKAKCKGPIAYYEDLRCTPIYGEDKCCPVKYNCDHLNGRPTDKCYYKGHVYETHEKIKEEVAKPCDKGCICSTEFNEIAQFICAPMDCAGARVGCFLKATHDICCSYGPEVCPETDTDVAKCEVDGRTYLDGQRFEPKSDPTQSCICGEGYTGKNVAPFCRTRESDPCGVEIHQSYSLHKNCSPVFYSDQNPATDCNSATRCQNEDDVVLPAQVSSVSNPADTCKFGNLTMKVGEELKQGTAYGSVCVKCVCDVPPIPTCQRLADDVCDVTVHKKFGHYSN